MSVTNSIVDFFQGNPFQNPIGALIERATDIKNESENWTLFMEVCDHINATEDGPKLAIRAIRRRINSEINKSNCCVLYSLSLLETLVKNCGYRFHLVVCTREVLQDFEKFILASANNTNINGRFDIPVIVRDKILYLIQSWYDSFKNQPDLKEIQFTYMRLKDCAIQFPMQDINTMSPIHSPVQPNKPIQNKSVPIAAHITQSEGDTRPATKRQTKKPQESMSFEKIVEKLSNELNKVQTNIDVLGELMTDYPTDQKVPDEAFTLMKNLHIVLCEMQKRMIQLINKWNEQGNDKDSSVLQDSLRVIDELNSVVTRYERYERSIQASQSSTVAKEPQSATNDQKQQESDLTERINKSKIIDVYAAQQEAEHFYDGFAQGSTSAASYNNGMKSDNSSNNMSKQNALSSQEFDMFLNERSTHPSSASNEPNNKTSTTNKASVTSPLLQPVHSSSSKSANKKSDSELFDL